VRGELEICSNTTPNLLSAMKISNRRAGFTATELLVILAVLHQGNVAVADGSVHQFSQARLMDALGRTGQATNRLAVP
jgi:hypothetical protein